MKLTFPYKVWGSSFLILVFFLLDTILLYLSLTSEKATAHNLYLQLGISTIFYIMAIVSIIQFAFFREATYFYYIMYLLFYLCYFTLIFSNNSIINNNTIPYFIELRPIASFILLLSSYLIYTLFAIEFLKVKSKNTKLYKKLNLLCKIYIFLIICMVISYIFFKENNDTGGLIRLIILSSCIPLGIFGIILIFTKAKNIFGYILTLGSTFIFIGSVTGFLFSFGIVPYPSHTFPFSDWLFYTMLGAVIEVIIFFSSFAYRNKILATEEQIAKEKLQHIRDEISRDLHDDVGASLSNINILNELAKRNTHNPEKATEYLTKAGEDIQNVSESLHDIVWNINSKYDDIDNLFVRMKRYAADMMGGKNIDFEIELPKNLGLVKLEIDKRKDLYFIFKETVNNLVKYSKATKASIIIKLENDKLLLTVTDNGIGFSDEKLFSGNGLYNMQHRAKYHQAKLKVQTKLDQGTSITLEMPLNT